MSLPARCPVAAAGACVLLSGMTFMGRGHFVSPDCKTVTEMKCLCFPL